MTSVCIQKTMRSAPREASIAQSEDDDALQVAVASLSEKEQRIRSAGITDAALHQQNVTEETLSSCPARLVVAAAPAGTNRKEFPSVFFSLWDARPRMAEVGALLTEISRSPTHRNDDPSARLEERARASAAARGAEEVPRKRPITRKRSIHEVEEGQQSANTATPTGSEEKNEGNVDRRAKEGKMIGAEEEATADTQPASRERTGRKNERATLLRRPAPVAAVGDKRSGRLIKYDADGTVKIQAPPGKLGVWFQTVGGVSVVTALRKDSPLAGSVEPGDRILEVDGLDVSHLDPDKIVAHLTTRKGSARVLTVTKKKQMRAPINRLRSFLSTLDSHPEGALRRANVRLSRTTPERDLTAYYASRPALAIFTIVKELDRVDYTVVTHEGAELTAPEEIREYYRTRPHSQRDGAPGELLWRAANQSVLADALTGLTDALAAEVPGLGASLRAAETSFRLDWGGEVPALRVRAVLDAAVPVAGGGRRATLARMEVAVEYVPGERVAAELTGIGRHPDLTESELGSAEVAPPTGGEAVRRTATVSAAQDFRDTLHEIQGSTMEVAAGMRDAMGIVGSVLANGARHINSEIRKDSANMYFLGIS